MKSIPWPIPCAQLTSVSHAFELSWPWTFVPVNERHSHDLFLWAPMTSALLSWLNLKSRHLIHAVMEAWTHLRFSKHHFLCTPTIGSVHLVSDLILALICTSSSAENPSTSFSCLRYPTYKPLLERAPCAARLLSRLPAGTTPNINSMSLGEILKARGLQTNLIGLPSL